MQSPHGTRARPPRPTVGWREWVSFPGLQIPPIKAKLDTGARSSALHAFDLEVFERNGVALARFMVHPIQRDSHKSFRVEAEVQGERTVRSSGGHQERRTVVLIDLSLLGQEWRTEVTLTRRDQMGFRMLLGRSAVRGRFLVDPARSFLGGRFVRGRLVPRKVARSMRGARSGRARTNEK